MKLKDMSSITARTIVSASGFTKPAVAKAQAHGVRLLHLRPWTQSMATQFDKFADAGPPADFFRHFYSVLLTWADRSIYLLTPSHPEAFEWDRATLLYDAKGRPHKEFQDGGALEDALLLRSTEILHALQPARDRGEQMPEPRL